MTDKLAIAFTTAQRAIERLERARIVKRVGDAKRDRVYCATALLDILEVSDNPDSNAMLGVSMSNHKLAKLLTDTLPSGRATLFNPWRDPCTDDKLRNDPEAKLARLAAHLDCDPKLILCGEAQSYRGCRHSGIAFTSEHLLLEGTIPRIPAMSHRLTIKKSPYKEGSATTIWKVLYELGIEERTVLWNAIQMHPHKPGKQTVKSKTNFCRDQ